jgi:hypothetical protein
MNIRVYLHEEPMPTYEQYARFYGKAFARRKWLRDTVQAGYDQSVKNSDEVIEKASRVRYEEEDHGEQKRPKPSQPKQPPSPVQPPSPPPVAKEQHMYSAGETVVTPERYKQTAPSTPQPVTSREYYAPVAPQPETPVMNRRARLLERLRRSQPSAARHKLPDASEHGALAKWTPG